MQYYIAKILVVVGADSHAEACDAIAEGLRRSVTDWAYLADDPEGAAQPFPAVSDIEYEDGRMSEHWNAALEAEKAKRK